MVNNSDKTALLYNSKGKGEEITVENIGGVSLKSKKEEQGKQVCKATATRCAFCFCLQALRGSDIAKMLKQNKNKKKLQCSVVNSGGPL